MRTIALAILWLLQALLIVLLIDAQWLERQARVEEGRIALSIGPARFAYLSDGAAAVYRSWFVRSGAVKASYERLLPDHSHSQKGMDGIAPWFFAWLEHRIDAFWWTIYRALIRVQLWRVWGLPIIVITAAATIDGLARRSVMRVNRIGPSSDRYRVSGVALLVLIFLAALHLTIPMCVSPAVVPAWGVAFGLTIRIWLANTQHRI